MARSLLGTNVASAIRPFTDADKFATAYANEILGGCHNYQSLEELYAIPKDRRQLYMLCTVSEDIYQLIKDTGTEYTDQSCWKLIDYSNSNVDIDGTSYNLTEYLKNIMTMASKKYFQFVNYVYDDGTIAGIEVLCPFKCTVSKISSTIPVDKTLTQDITIQIQYFSNTSWNTVGTVTINSSTKEGSYTPITTITIPSGSRLRIQVSGLVADRIDTISTLVEVLAEL